jgi:pimeloyl-ACP methyl ester carboxylesterase
MLPLIGYALAVPLVDVNGLRLLAEESGSGDPLVLVYGSWDDRRVWALIEADLARSFHVVSYDRRGHGVARTASSPDRDAMTRTTSPA